MHLYEITQSCNRYNCMHGTGTFGIEDAMHSRTSANLVLVRPYQATISPRIFECQFEYLNLARECCSGDSECCKDFGTNFSRHTFFCKRLDLEEVY